LRQKDRGAQGRWKAAARLADGARAQGPESLRLQDSGGARTAELRHNTRPREAPMTDTALKTTPLNAAHRALGARMVGFGGYDMPVQYEGVLAEHRWTREHAGLFDVSHMGQCKITG